jgi:drug/metabolite transporter (DMT)-like permease
MNLDFPHAGEVYSALCALLWAVAVILFRKSGEKVTPVVLNLFKDVTGLILLCATMLILSVEFFPAEQTAEDWIILLVSGVIGIGIADTIFFASLNRLGAGRSAIVDCLYSPFVILCSLVHLDESFGPLLIVALVMMVSAIFIGTWQPELTDKPEDKKQIKIGVILGVISMACMAIGISMAKPVLDRSDPWWATTVRMVSGTAFLAVIVACTSRRKEFIKVFRPSALWKVTVPAAVVGAYLAVFFWIAGMKYTETTTASVLNQSSNVFVIFLATLFLKERLTTRKLIAICMGFAGGVIATL